MCGDVTLPINEIKSLWRQCALLTVALPSDITVVGNHAELGQSTWCVEAHAAQWRFELHVLDPGQREDRAPKTPLRFLKTGTDMSTITDDTDPANWHIVA